MCDFDAASLRCRRCGYLARSLPTFRVCRTIHEMAYGIVEQQASRRIHVPQIKIGTAIAKTLAAVGITKERVSAVIGKDCGCAGRQRSLDAVGEIVSVVVEKAVNAAVNAVLPNPVLPDDVAAVANALQASPVTNEGLKSPTSDVSQS